MMALRFFALLHVAAAQFDWGSGCEGGVGTQFSVTLSEGQTVRRLPAKMPAAA